MNISLVFRQISDRVWLTITNPFRKSRKSVNPSETDIVHKLLDRLGYCGVMIDVGAHFGSSLAPFARRGWNVYAFEPDSSNRLVLQKHHSDQRNVVISDLAVSDKVMSEVPFFTSEESTGISGLSSFRDSHVASQTVTTTTLTHVLDEQKINMVDFLKIDTEGFDLYVLKGFPWGDVTNPRAIVCEFEDSKTIPLGYSYDEMANYLIEKGYKILVSEWYPIESYGGGHKWDRFFIYPSGKIKTNAWGNLIAIDDDVLFDELVKLCGV